MAQPMAKNSRGHSLRPMVQAARRLRRQATPAEVRLWDSLRNRGLDGLKFRRQHPYGRFVIDFFCVEAQLAIEVDGGAHLDPQQIARDAERTAVLQSHGLTVLRLTVEELEADLPAVLARIACAAGRSFYPGASRKHCA